MYKNDEKKKWEMVKEAEVAYKLRKENIQGEYTVEDYLAWPKDEKIELIDGVIYEMASPIDKHQLIASEIGTILRNYIKKIKENVFHFLHQ